MRPTSLTILLLSLSSAAQPPRPANEIQSLVDAEVTALARDPKTRLAMVLVLDPGGKVLAAGGQRAGTVDRSLPEKLRRDPCSVMKTFTIGAALEAGLITPKSTISGEGGRWQGPGRVIEDGSPHGELSVDDVLAFSSNIGTAKIFAKLGHERLETTLRELGIPTPPMADDAAAVGVSYGADVSPTPLEVAKAYAAIASGRAFPTHHDELMTLLQHTVDRDDGTGRGARISGVAVAGKTGTCAVDEHTAYADFVGIIPAQAPRFVVLVAIETTAKGYSGGTIAGPAFARLGAKLLAR
jgi:cell division protein FtsI (penicillin-binding protein 3)